MTEISDLSERGYCVPEDYIGLTIRAIGWLGGNLPCFADGIERADLPADLLPAIRYFSKEAYHEDWELGAHTCELCGAEEFHGEFWLSKGQVCYVAPVALEHYISEHGYRPPQEFIDALRTEWSTLQNSGRNVGDG